MIVEESEKGSLEVRSSEEVRGEQEDDQQQRREAGDPDDARAQIVLDHVVVASRHEVEVDDVHGLAVVLERRDAVVMTLELDAVAAGEVALEDVVRLAVAREVIIDRADRVHLEDDVAGVTRRLQDVIAVETQDLDGVLVAQMKALDQIDLVVEDVEAANVREADERVPLHHAEVALLDVDRVDVRQAAEGVGLQPGQIHVAELELADVLEAVEGVLLDRADAGREDEIVDVGQAGERVAADRQQRIVAQQDHVHVRRAGERVALDVADLVVRQQQHRDVLQRGERELLDARQRGVLDRQLAQPVQPAERERSYGGDVVTVQHELM